MKHKLIAMLLTIAVIMAVTGCQRDSGEVKYNDDPDLSGKIVASGKSSPESLEQMLDRVDVIVTVSISDDGKIADVDEDPYKLTCFLTPPTLTEAEIEESIYGDLNKGDKISLIQCGLPGENDYQTKVKKGERLVLLLERRENGVYVSPFYEHGMFYLDEKDKITSMSDAPICARYDGLHKNVLKNDLLEAMPEKQESDKNLLYVFTDDVCVGVDICETSLTTVTLSGLGDDYKGVEVTDNFKPRNTSIIRDAKNAVVCDKICPKVGNKLELRFCEKIPESVKWFTGFIDTETHKMEDDFETSDIIIPEKQFITLSTGFEETASDADRLYDRYRFISIVCDFGEKLVEYTFFPENYAEYLRYSAIDSKIDTLEILLWDQRDFYAGMYFDNDTLNINLANNDGSNMTDAELIEYIKSLIADTYSGDIKYNIVKFSLADLSHALKCILDYYGDSDEILDFYRDEKANKIYVGYSDSVTLDKEKIKELAGDSDMLEFFVISSERADIEY